jgi:rRNA maturation endonuclease Nob1
MTPILIGAAFAATALAFVLWPLFVPAGARPQSARVAGDVAGAAHDSAVRALREIEFDRATGKLGDADYAALSAEYTARALTELRESDKAAASVGAASLASGDEDSAESLVRKARAAVRTCAQCGSVCPESDAVFCSACGSRLAA